MAVVSVPALYDADLNFFLPSGKMFTIDASSRILGIELLPGSLVPLPNTPGIQNIALLKVLDENLGILYLNMTLPQYEAAVQIASQGPNIERVTPAIIGTTPGFDAGSEFTLPEWFNISVDGIASNGATISVQLITFSQDNLAQTGTITFNDNTFVDGDSLDILYHKN